MKEAVLNKKIKHWEDQLLDLGKRNKMISFRETKRGTLKLMKPGFHELYKLLVTEEKELTFQKAIDRDSDVRVYSILSLLDQLSCPIDVTIGDIRAEGPSTEINKTLKHLRSKAKLAMDEQGTNILYLVFGFLEWHEKGSRNDNWIRSPLILVPVTLLLPSLNAQYSLKRHEDEIVVNPTLDYLFERDYGIKLPEFDADKDSLESFLQKMETLVEDRGWRIARECSMGLVSFLKISMYHDLIRNEEKLKKNLILRAFAGEQNHVNASSGQNYEFDHDAYRAVDSFQVLDADSSQQDAIMLSKKGVSFVMQGPPGTGKSQTITNIIAQALADGKKILFVSEKMAALDVVYRRLQDVHLADFCLPLHSHKANKKDILNQLSNNLNLQRIKVKDEEIAKLTRLDMLKEQLKAYVQDIHKTILPLEMSLYEVYGAILEMGTLPDIDLEMPQIDKLTKDEVNRLALLVMNVDKAQGVLGPQWYKNPWQGIMGSYLEVSQKRELQNQLRDAVRVLTSLESCRLRDKTLAQILTLDTLDGFLTLYEHAYHCTAVPNDWFSRMTELEEKLIYTIWDDKTKMDAWTGKLMQRYDQGFFALNGRQQYTQLVEAMGCLRGKLGHTETDEEAFSQLERDRDQLSRLQELVSLLTDAFHVLSAAYAVALPCDTVSLKVLLEICNLVQQNRELTRMYFGKERLQQLKQYVDTVRSRLELWEEKKEQVSRRYAGSVLDADELADQHRLLADALEKLYGNGLSRDLKYASIKTIADFDVTRLSRIEEIGRDSVLADTQSRYGFELADTIGQVHMQLSAIELLPAAKDIDLWQTAAGRRRSRQLLQTVCGNTERLAKEKAALETYFDDARIILDIRKLSAADLEKLQQAGVKIPEAARLSKCCLTQDAYAMLDEIEQNTAEASSLLRSVDEFRKEYHIVKSINHEQLLAMLKEHRMTAEFSAASPMWAEAQANAYALWEQISTLANSLRTQHTQFMQDYEASVFSLDYAAMIDRFKTEYTGFFKVFKSSYKEDVRQIRLVSKEVRKKLADEEILALLQKLRSYDEELKKYLDLSAETERLLEVGDYDIWYDWDQVKKRMDGFRDLCPVFKNGKDAHRFVSKGEWDTVIDYLTRLQELNDWFSGNDQARSMFGSLYRAKGTDTAAIRKDMEHIKNARVLFQSTADYLQYMDDNSRVQNHRKGLTHAAAVVELRSWFENKIDEIEGCTGIRYNENEDCWQNVSSELEAYEQVAAAFGNQAASRLIAAYPDNKPATQQLREALQVIDDAERCAEEVFQRSSIGQDQTIPALIGSIQDTVSSARNIIAVYDELAPYALEDVKVRAPAELKLDLEDIIFCRNTDRQMKEQTEEARNMIGSEFCGAATNWTAVASNLQLADRINNLISGEIPAEIADAFVKKTRIYSESQLVQLDQYMHEAEQIGKDYPELCRIRELDARKQRITDAIEALDTAISVKNCTAPYAFVPVTFDTLSEDLNMLQLLQDAQRDYAQRLADAQRLMPTFALSEETNWEDIAAVFEHMKQVKRAVSTGNLDPELIQWLTNGMNPTRVDAYDAQLRQLIRHRSFLSEFTGMFENRESMEKFPLSKLGRRIQSCDEQFATMDAWIDLRNCRNACRRHGLEQFLTKAEDAYYPTGALKDVFLKSFYYAWFEKVCAEIESVADFRVRTQTMRVEDFRELDAHQLPVDQMRIRERLIREMPNRNSLGRATDEMSILLHELNKKRNIMALRKLFRAIPNLLLRLKPCLMMSPLSVSYFLEAETYKFDMVIFDEASQIFPQDAIGAIFRSNQVIIAGDSKQLPPTNFFAASTTNDADFDAGDEDEEEMIYDSILEEASNALPNRSLLWHYRSRYEDLISFSNQEIYQNDLITFPSSTIRVADTGVEYVYVRNGVYEGRCNRAEAQQIVQLVAEHIRKHPDRSLGVIAFSENQQSVIEEEINKFRTKNPFYERFFDENRDEPFFVKNLENVQGDERDTIIFSICYGKNAQGRMYMRFGPLGHVGGERRLNVAITRAKRNIKLVGSILPEDIDLSKTHSEGVRMLRSYIGYAMHGSVMLNKHEKKNSLYDVDTFSEQVGRFLTQRGCKVQMNVGNSDYTIDIAIEHPKRPGHYVAGIECDGNSYYMARTVRDREHLRTTILEQMGWRMYRVWSTEWIRNPAGEQERLMEFVRSALIHYGEHAVAKTAGGDAQMLISTETVKTGTPARPQDPNNPYGFMKYEEGKWWEVRKYRASDNLSMLADRILAVVKVEQPIHIDLLYRRLADAFGMTKATQSVRDTVDEAIRKRMQDEVYISDDFVYLSNFSKVKVRRSDLGAADRIIEYISIPEIAAAMERILVGTIGMERSVLCSEAAKVFGFERNGPKIKQRTNEAVDYLVRKQKISVVEEKVQLLEG